MEPRIIYCDMCKTNYILFLDITKTKNYFRDKKDIYASVVSNCPHCDDVYIKRVPLKYIIGVFKI